MCPECIATAAWVYAGVASTGGLLTVTVKKLRAKSLFGSAKSGDRPDSKGHGVVDGERRIDRDE